MKLQVFDRFLSQGSGQLQGGAFVGVGIHSSSHVESVDIGGQRLGVKSVLPLSGGQDLHATRISLVGTCGPFNPDIAAPIDNAPYAGEKLVLQLYESCDELNVPGPRAPYLTRANLATTPTTAAAAKLLAILPYSGRTRAALFWNAANTTATIQLVGMRMNFGVSKGFYPVPNTTAYATPAVANAAGAGAGSYNSRALYIDNESFDALLVYAWDSAGGLIDFLGEVTGERL